MSAFLRYFFGVGLAGFVAGWFDAVFLDELVLVCLFVEPVGLFGCIDWMPFVGVWFFVWRV